MRRSLIFGTNSSTNSWSLPCISREFAQIDVVPAAQLAGGHHVVVLFSDSLAMEQPHADR